jgi:hypothetical protein
MISQMVMLAGAGPNSPWTGTRNPGRQSSLSLGRNEKPRKTKHPQREQETSFQRGKMVN